MRKNGDIEGNLFCKHENNLNRNRNSNKHSIRNITIFFLSSRLSSSEIKSGLTCGLRNCNPRASKLSKSPGDYTWPGPHQPLT